MGARARKQKASNNKSLKTLYGPEIPHSILYPRDI